MNPATRRATQGPVTLGRNWGHVATQRAPNVKKQISLRAEVFAGLEAEARQAKITVSALQLATWLGSAMMWPSPSPRKTVRRQISSSRPPRHERSDRLRRRTWMRYGLIGLMLAGLAPFGLGWLKVNLMASVPLGVYAIIPIHGPLQAGALVTFRTAASAALMRQRHGWLAGFWPMLKPVAGLPGDLVCHGQEGIVIRRADTGDVVAYGPTELPTAFPETGVCVVVPTGMLYAASDHPHSLDSRYVGWVPQSAIQGIARPVWTWSGADRDGLD
jgi:conjugative transfer signal peptidase TraF